MQAFRSVVFPAHLLSRLFGSVRYSANGGISRRPMRDGERKEGCSGCTPSPRGRVRDGERCKSVERHDQFPRGRVRGGEPDAGNFSFISSAGNSSSTSRQSSELRIGPGQNGHRCPICRHPGASRAAGAVLAHGVRIAPATYLIAACARGVWICADCHQQRRVNQGGASRVTFSPILPRAIHSIASSACRSWRLGVCRQMHHDCMMAEFAAGGRPCFSPYFMLDLRCIRYRVQ